jgi:hypothetical protein
MASVPSASDSPDLGTWNEAISRLREQLDGLGRLLHRTGDAFIAGSIPLFQLDTVSEQFTACFDCARAIENSLRTAAATFNQPGLVSETVVTIADLEAAAARIVALELNRKLHKTRKRVASALLDDILTIRPRDPTMQVSDLEGIRAQAVGLQTRLAELESDTPPIELLGLTDQTHPRAALHTLVECGGDPVDLEAAEQYRQVLAGAYSYALAWHASLGRLVFGARSDEIQSEAPTEPAANGSLAQRQDLPYESPHSKDEQEEAPPPEDAAAASIPHAEPIASVEESLPPSDNAAADAGQESAIAQAADPGAVTSSGTPTIIEGPSIDRQRVISTELTPSATSTGRLAHGSGGGEQESAEGPALPQRTLRDAAGPEAAESAQTALWSLVEKGSEDLAYHLATTARDKRLPSPHLLRATALGHHIAQADGGIATVLKDDFGALAELELDGDSAESHAHRLLVGHAANAWR